MPACVLSVFIVLFIIVTCALVLTYIYCFTALIVKCLIKDVNIAISIFNLSFLVMSKYRYEGQDQRGPAPQEGNCLNSIVTFLQW